VISPQVQRSARETGETPALPFTVLRDRGNEVARRYGLVFTLPDDLQRIYAGFGLDLPKINGAEEWTLPVPARLVLDRGGIVRSVAADPDYTRRPEAADTLDVLKRLAVQDSRPPA
jgi:peroxiredoxin